MNLQMHSLSLKHCPHRSCSPRNILFLRRIFHCDDFAIGSPIAPFLPRFVNLTTSSDVNYKKCFKGRWSSSKPICKNCWNFTDRIFLKESQLLRCVLCLYMMQHILAVTHIVMTCAEQEAGGISVAISAGIGISAGRSAPAACWILDQRLNNEARHPVYCKPWRVWKLTMRENWKLINKNVSRDADLHQSQYVKTVEISQIAYSWRNHNYCVVFCVYIWCNIFLQWHINDLCWTRSWRHICGHLGGLWHLCWTFCSSSLLNLRSKIKQWG